VRRKCVPLRRFLDTIATQHRNWRSIAIAVVFAGVLVWASYEFSTNELVEITYENATVVEVIPFGDDSNLYKGELTLNDSTTIEVLLPKPVPRVGDQLPLRIEHYEDGTHSYGVDVEKWQTEGSE